MRFPLARFILSSTSFLSLIIFCIYYYYHYYYYWSQPRNAEHHRNTRSAKLQWCPTSFVSSSLAWLHYRTLNFTNIHLPHFQQLLRNLRLISCLYLKRYRLRWNFNWNLTAKERLMSEKKLFELKFEIYIL